MSALNQLIKVIEQTLAVYYRFSPLTAAAGHIVTKTEICEIFGEAVATLPEWDARASVWLTQDDKSIESLFIGLFIDNDLRQTLQEHNPIVKLSDLNLDAFCVLVEELSHFHLIINRAAIDRPVTKLELEWQGEVDKLLVSALFLKKQSGDSHIRALMWRLFDNSSITSSQELVRYEEAIRFAARFWQFICRDPGAHDGTLRYILNQIYRASWRQKVVFIDGLELPQVS